MASIKILAGRGIMNFRKNICAVRSLYLAILYIFSLLIFISIGDKISYADIVALKDGSIINGKILRRTRYAIIFGNFYGTFTLRNVYLKSVHETTDYKEDVKILKKLGQKVNVTVVKRNFDSGTREKRKIRSEEKVSMPVRRSSGLVMRCSLASTYLLTTGRLKEYFPSGYGEFFAFDLGPRKSVLIPSLRTEAGYLYYSKETAQITGVSTMAGPLWLVPFMSRHNGRIHLSVISGVTYLNRIMGKDFQSKDFTFSLSSTVGYDYHFTGAFLFLHGRYLHVFGERTSLTGMGVEFGIGYRFK